MSRRRAASLIETLIVIAIIALLIGLSLPTIGTTRRRADEMICKNNLHQINLAVAQFVELQKRLPEPGRNNVIGGWTVEVLPFLDQKNLRDRITPGGSIPTSPEFLLRQPRIMTCPVRVVVDPPNPGAMDHAHYILVPVTGRRSYNVFDAPLDVKLPWASGPEMTYDDVVSRMGPHNGGFFYARGFQEGVNFQPGAGSQP